MEEDSLLRKRANKPNDLLLDECCILPNRVRIAQLQSGISRDEIYIAPSAVQKERIQPDDLFIQNIDGDDLQSPPDYKKLSKSQCTPLFMLAYREKNAGAVIHTHSPSAVIATLL
ncbi:conserved hypothetical protein [Culex quinquefasciatus]|uniref:Class II aldolase/adducin N-terminal domain-containing protein n=1 Tax=Culex quinquefasciatus TaxID=7176 RepID=B0WW03_CULQU|nr:conserved hypothetical protein [Culex quinquefasciatus]|eukprot:XP_001861575.1 conserved hypothetical protein [Culex quinquefasciatus]